MRYVVVILASLLLAACGPGDPEAGKRVAEASALAAYPELPKPGDVPALQAAGKPIFKAAGCETCHSSSHDRNGLMGPPLGGVAETVLAQHKGDPLEARRWMVKHIRDPQRFPGQHAGTDDYRGSAMPPNGMLKDADLRALVEFLWHLP